jgi:hypothetical protein
METLHAVLLLVLSYWHGLTRDTRSNKVRNMRGIFFFLNKRRKVKISILVLLYLMMTCCCMVYFYHCLFLIFKFLFPLFSTVNFRILIVFRNYFPKKLKQHRLILLDLWSVVTLMGADSSLALIVFVASINFCII